MKHQKRRKHIGMHTVYIISYMNSTLDNFKQFGFYISFGDLGPRVSGRRVRYTESGLLEVQ